MKTFKFIAILFIFIGMILTLFLTTFTTISDNPLIYREVMPLYYLQTRAQNAVASIYLNYRIFDTIFETLMLLVSVIGVIHFSKHVADTSDEESKRFIISHLDENLSQKGSIYLIVPVVIFLGIYIILNGHVSPGGGFQGGAALTAATICVYLVRPSKTIPFYKYELFEKYIFLFILSFSLIFAVSNIYLKFPRFNVVYLIVMNTLIGIKVFLGLSIVFFRFVHYEDK